MLSSLWDVQSYRICRWAPRAEGVTGPGSLSSAVASPRALQEKPSLGEGLTSGFHLELGVLFSSHTPSEGGRAPSALWETENWGEDLALGMLCWWAWSIPPCWSHHSMPAKSILSFPPSWPLDIGNEGPPLGQQLLAESPAYCGGSETFQLQTLGSAVTRREREKILPCRTVSQGQ